MPKSYDLYLVALSLIVAILVSNTALSLFLRISRAASPKCRLLWLTGGGTSMGCGIWATHFIGMLALSMPIRLTYDWTTTIASLLLAVIASVGALSLMMQARTTFRLAASALVLGGGIATMHYLGMAAIQIVPGIGHDPLLVLLSVGIGFAGSYCALWVLFRGRQLVGLLLAKALSACLLGVAIGGLHYAGMWASRFSPGAYCLAAGGADDKQLAMIVAAVALALMAFTGALLLFDEYLHSRVRAYNTQLLNVNAQLEYAATHDALTGLPNRVLFRRMLDEIVVRAAQTPMRFGVMLIDLDRFKEINDSLGHQAGDQLLIALSRRMSERTQTADVLARLGGDEFVLLMPDLVRPDDALARARTLLQLIATPVRLCELDVHVTASIGVALNDADASAEVLLKRADTAMYHSKNNGRNSSTVFSPAIQIASRERLEIDDGLHKALIANEFELHYQPKLDCATLRIEGAEALIRWRHPRRGLMSPATFIPLAEETGMIVPIGEWAIRAACQQIALWQERGFGEVPIAVNVSPQQFERYDFVDVVERSLADFSVEPRLLELEFTETTVMKDPRRSTHALEKLAALGVRISLDDFGTGYSSLSYLRKLPLTALKIDRSFVADLRTDQGAGQIVRAIVALSHNMNLQVIAEGVESAKDLAFLRSIGCDEFQGFYFSPAVPERAFEALLRISRSETVWDSGLKPKDRVA